MVESDSKKNKIIYIAGCGRSGSTLLERIISSSPNAVSVGELKFFYDFIKERKEFNKGRSSFLDLEKKRLRDSYFWGPIVKRAEEENLSFFRRGAKISKLDALIFVFTGRSRVKGLDFDEFRLAEIILERAREVKGEQVSIIIDSSNDFKKMMSWLANGQIDLNVIFMVKSAKRYVASGAGEKGKLYWLELVFLWIKVNLSIFMFLFFRLPKNKRINIMYSDFCRDPKKYLDHINQKFGLMVDSDNFIEKANNERQFSFAGNKMSGQPIKEVKIDDKWKTKLSFFQKTVIEILSFIPSRIFINSKR